MCDWERDTVDWEACIRRVVAVEAVLSRELIMSTAAEDRLAGGLKSSVSEPELISGVCESGDPCPSDAVYGLADLRFNAGGGIGSVVGRSDEVLSDGAGLD